MDNLMVMGFRLVGTIEWRQENGGIKSDVNDDEAKLERCIYLIVIAKQVVKVGTCKFLLRNRIRSYAVYCNDAICRFGVGTPMTMNESEEWHSLLLEGGPGQIWATEGTMVETPIGKVNAYLSEGEELVKRWRPTLNRKNWR